VNLPESTCGERLRHGTAAGQHLLPRHGSGDSRGLRRRIEIALHLLRDLRLQASENVLGEAKSTGTIEAVGIERDPQHGQDDPASL
jgi:hypothetical protein